MATETASFGAGKRESHDSSAFYRRRMVSSVPDIAAGGVAVPPPHSVIDRLFCKSSESMEEIPDDCVALMVTSPPYNVGKEYDDDLTLGEYLGLLHRVFAETHRVLEPGGRIPCHRHDQIEHVARSCQVLEHVGGVRRPP